MGERTLADKRLTGTKIHIGRFIDETRQLGELPDARLQHFIGHIQPIDWQSLKSSRHCRTLADAIHRSLHLHCVGVDRGERIRYCQVAIVAGNGFPPEPLVAGDGLASSMW